MSKEEFVPNLKNCWT